MDLRQLGYFLAVVDHGGVTPAAAAVHVAQPSLSQAIRGLERELGVTLFRREGRVLRLTPAGEALVEPARQVLAGLADAQAAVGAVAALAAGWLDLAAHDQLAVDPLAPVLAAFGQRYPGVAVRVRTPADEDELVRLVRDGRCELGLTFLPVHPGGLRVRELGRQEARLVLPPGWPPVPDPLPVAALDGWPLVAGPDGYPAVRTALRSALRAAGAHLYPAVHTDHQEAVVPLVLAGTGVAFAGTGYARLAAGCGALVRRLEPPVSCPFGLVQRAESASPAGAAFIAMLVDSLGGSGQPAADP